MLNTGGIYVFLVELPILDNEMFHSVKPGLSAYANSPEMVSSWSNQINYIKRKEKVLQICIVIE